MVICSVYWNRSITSDRWCTDTCKSNPLWQRFNTLHVSILYDTRGSDNLQSVFLRSSHSLNQKGTDLDIIFQVFRTLLGTTIASSLLEKQLTETSSFCYEVGQSTISLIYIMWYGCPYTSLPLESTYVPRWSDSLLCRVSQLPSSSRTKTCRIIPLMWLPPTPICSRKSPKSRRGPYLYSAH